LHRAADILRHPVVDMCIKWYNIVNNQKEGIIMIIRNKESGETIEVMDGTIIAESAWKVVGSEPASDEEDSEIESDTEVETEDAGKNKKK